MPSRTKARTKQKKQKSNKKAPSTNIADQDERFLDLSKNPMFREMAKREKKVVIDSRFKHMLKDKQFEERNSRVDKRGRPIHQQDDDFLGRIYELDEEEELGRKDSNQIIDEENSEDDQMDEEENQVDEEEKLGFGDKEEEPSDGEDDSSSDEEDEDTKDLPKIQLDLARGEGPEVSSSSSDDEDDEEDEESESGLEIEEKKEAANTLDSGVREVQWASSRLAVCNLDWGRLSAEDLMLVLHSFKPTSGKISSVSVYMSDFGVESLEEEKKFGPRLKLKSTKKGDLDDLEERTKQAIRAYELGRLRYYYAVCECDTVDTASAIYEACDGVEFEASGMRFDLRFIPDDMQFEENRLRDRITWDQIEPEQYKPKKRVNAHPLVCSNPKISWEETDPERGQRLRNAFQPTAKLDDFEGLIGPASDEEDEQKSRYEQLISATNESIEDNKQQSEAGSEGMQLTRENEEAAVDVRDDDEEGIEQQAHGKHIFSADGQDREITDENSSDDDDRPKEKRKTKFQLYLERKKRLKSERKLQDKEQKKARKRRRMTADDEIANGTGDDVVVEQMEKDERFGAFFKDSAFAVDRTHSQYKGGDLAKKQVYTKMKRRDQRRDEAKEEDDGKNIDEHKSLQKTNEKEQTEELVQRLKKKQKILDKRTEKK